MRLIHEHYGIWAFLLAFIPLAVGAWHYGMKAVFLVFPPDPEEPGEEPEAEAATGEEPGDSADDLMDDIRAASELRQRGVRDWLNQKFGCTVDQNRGE